MAPQSRLERYQQGTEWPLIAVALAFLAMYSVRVLNNPHGEAAKVIGIHPVRHLLCLHRRLHRPTMACTTAWWVVPQAPPGAPHSVAAVLAFIAPAESCRGDQRAPTRCGSHNPGPGDHLYRVRRSPHRLRRVAGDHRHRGGPAPMPTSATSVMRSGGRSRRSPPGITIWYRSSQRVGSSPWYS